MEAALLSGFLNTILAKLLALAEETYRVWPQIKEDIKYLERELYMINGVIKDQLSTGSDHNPSHLQGIKIEVLRKLAHEIEDCTDNLMYEVLRNQQVSSMHRYLRRLRTCRRIAGKVKRLKALPKEQHERSARYGALTNIVTSQPPQYDMVAPTSAESDQDTQGHEVVDFVVGIDDAREDLNELLKEEATVERRQLKVVAIVGFPGSGKTVLATAMYRSQAVGDGGRFDLKARVQAGERGSGEVLGDLGVQILRTSVTSLKEHRTSVTSLKEQLKQHLERKKYLIVIDDMRTVCQWDDIEGAFPRNDQISSRIVVTTTMKSVANVCCSRNGYEHKIARLDYEHSKTLFLKKACPESHINYDEPYSDKIIERCDGQALALVTVGQFLRKNGWPTSENCGNLCRRLRQNLLEDETSERMRRVLINSYDSLPDYDPKACLLYFGMFPCDHLVRRKTLMRLWLAEGFLSGAQDAAAKNFSELLNRSIIEAVDVSNNGMPKTCRTFGMMREFILFKSISQDFIALPGDEMHGNSTYVRRLSLHHRDVTNEDIKPIKLSHVRSLVVFGEATEAIFMFEKYRLLRVLDLKECTSNNLDSNHLKKICKLRLLKYLGLGATGNVSRLPTEIGNLRLLETLDLRRTRIDVLPREVILLPCLIHLFGRFKLSAKVKTSEVDKHFAKVPSALETLAGFIITDTSQAFAQIMRKMKKLKKVKIWYEGTTTGTNSLLSGAIQEFIHDTMEDSPPARSLSLHLGECSEDLLDSLKGPCYLSSLKLQGKLLTKLPQFVILLRNLTELCLESNAKLTVNLLNKLSELKYLRYLKLVADDLDDEFVFDKGSFDKLLRLSLVLERPTLPTIEEGALKHLISLQLLFSNLNDHSDMKIDFLPFLKDVTLDAGVPLGTKLKWEEAAKKHPNKPKVLLLAVNRG